MQPLITFLFLASIAGMFTTSWNWHSYAAAILAAVGFCGLYLFAGSLW